MIGITIIKRNKREVPFNREKIEVAIQRAADECQNKISSAMLMKLSEEVTAKVKVIVKKNSNLITVEQVQDTIEEVLMLSGTPELAKLFMLYRYERTLERSKKSAASKHRLLKDDFISKYKHSETKMTQLGAFIYYRTYSRWLPEEGRREYWWETVRRAVEYNCSLVQTTQEEAEKLYDNIYNLKQFLSGRTFWTGGTDAAKRNGMSNFNCSFTIIDSLTAFTDMFHLLMVGSGAGFRVLPEDAKKMPKLRQDITCTHEAYTAIPKNMRNEYTNIEHKYGTTSVITVGDSKFGWVEALRNYFNIISQSQYHSIQSIVFNYDNVRPRGERLITFGGTASGHVSLKNMIKRIDKVVKSRFVLGSQKAQLTSLDAIDIANIIAENVKAGGVRRSSQVALVSQDDTASIDAKTNLYSQRDGEWILDESIAHRQMSNNSIYYEEKPTREKLHWQIEKMRYSGEPGFANAEAATLRRADYAGSNPCMEILLTNKGLCNLTEVNVMAFIKADGTLDREGLLEAQRLSARAGYRMTFIDLELPEWDTIQKRDRLLGCSLTGWQDMVNATNLDMAAQAVLLTELKAAVKNASDSFADHIGMNKPLLATTIKPSGTLSLLPTVSSGVHYSHSPYFIRRVRISADDPLTKVCEELDYPVLPEVGQDADNCTTKVIEFPVKAPVGKTKYDISAIEQLETYKMFQEHYVEHNTSITVHVRAHEWEEVEQWVWDNWDHIVAVSFLSLDDNFYQMMPFEAIDKAEFTKRRAAMKQFAPHLVNKYELEDNEKELDSECASGACPTR